MNIQFFHLLWPTEDSRETHHARKEAIDDAFIKNLGVEHIIQAICINDKYKIRKPILTAII